VKLRSASTIDKSRPKIQADGEDIPKLVVRQYDETFSGPNGYSPPISTSASADNYCESPNGATPRAAPPPPRVSSGGAPKKPAAAFRLGGGGKDVPVDREKLLHSIKVYYL
jgi:hypothetical protein